MNAAKYYVGLDVGADLLSGCLTDEGGRILQEATLANSYDAVTTFLSQHADIDRFVIGLEAGSMGVVLARQLRSSGYKLRIFETRQASKFLKVRQNKTDVNDARGLADLTRVGGNAVAEVYLKSTACQHLRTQLVLRQKLVRQRVGGESAINSALRLNGGRLTKVRSATGLRRCAESELTRLRKTYDIDLTTDIEPILEICIATRRHLELLDRKLSKFAQDDAICARFMQIPGVGPITALSFCSAIEDPSRFKRSQDVGAYLGLVPRVRQSGQGLQHHRISKMGSTMTRAHLVSAAGTMMRESKNESSIRTWGMNLSVRIGRSKAKTALARKLAVVMIAMWKSDTPFLRDGTRPNPSAVQEEAPGA